MKKEVSEFLRFCIVGVLCTSIDAAIFYLFHTCASYQVSLISGYLLSLLVNYILTVYWTFKTESNIKNLIGIVSAHLFNLFVIRMGLMYIFVDTFSVNDRIAYIPTLMISVITNFIVVKLVINKLK